MKGLQMVDVLNGLGAPGTAAAELLRLEMEEGPEPFSPLIESALAGLNPFGTWEARMRALLRIYSPIRGKPNPAGWAVTTTLNHIGSLVQVLRTCSVAGVRVYDFPDLQNAAVLEALEKRLRQSGRQRDLETVGLGCEAFHGNSAVLEATWGGIYLWGIMQSIRTLLHAAGEKAHSALCARITFYRASKRRDVNDRLFLKETYLAGAAALDAFGRIALAAGRSNGHAIRIGARLLAVAADGSPRRAEVARADRQLVVTNSLSPVPEVRVFIRRRTSKARKPRVLWLRHPTAIRLIGELRAGPGGHELFRSTTGKPLTLRYLDQLLRRVTTLATGKPASYNLLRRANAFAEKSTAARGIQLGNNGWLANRVYHPDLASVGRKTLAEGRERARRVMMQHGYFPKTTRSIIASTNDEDFDC